MLDNKKNKIKVNRAKLSSEQVRAKEDFGTIISKHKKLTKRPIYKQKRFYFALFLILVIVYLIYHTEREAEVKSPVKTEMTN